jgi:hypothetical protein
MVEAEGEVRGDVEGAGVSAQAAQPTEATAA